MLVLYVPSYNGPEAICCLVNIFGVCMDESDVSAFPRARLSWIRVLCAAIGLGVIGCNKGNVEIHGWLGHGTETSSLTNTMSVKVYIER